MEETSSGEKATVEGVRCGVASAKDMPVIVATRLSLSFPVLLSAVPLCAKSPEPPERCWFSDGGISSNFPVHFFDRLVPRWPTFAINLRQFRTDGEESDNQRANTGMVGTEEEEIEDWWYRLPDRTSLPWRDRRLFEFVAGIVRTMQNRIDEAQMRVPGYRDRVAHVYLRKDQGGMNLAMDKKMIKALTKRGRWAAERLRLRLHQRSGVIGWRHLGQPPLGAAAIEPGGAGGDARPLRRRLRPRKARTGAGRRAQLPRTSRTGQT